MLFLKWLNFLGILTQTLLFLLGVAIGSTPSASAQSEIATPTATSTAISPLRTSSGADNNGLSGNGLSFINCSAGNSVSVNNLVIVGIDILGSGVTITPPSVGVWTQIGTTQTVNGEYESAIYWHQAGPSETGGPTFRFDLSPGTRAACVAAAYRNTCLDNPNNPCGNPILDSTTATSPLSFNLASSGVNTGFPSQVGGVINAEPLSLIVAVLGTSDTNESFGELGSSGPEIPGDFGGLPFISASSASVNVSIVVAQLSALGHMNSSPAGTAGPFSTDLPDRNDPPPLNIATISCSGQGLTTVTLQANQPSVKQYHFSSFQATISSVTPSGFNGTFRITPTSDASFTYTVGAACPGATGTGSAMTVQDQDPAIGDNVGVWVSIVPNLP